jgi:hypothetical protein
MLRRYIFQLDLVIIIFIYCTWVVTRWQLLFNTNTKHEIGLKQRKLFDRDVLLISTNEYDINQLLLDALWTNYKCFVASQI